MALFISSSSNDFDWPPSFVRLMSNVQSVYRAQTHSSFFNFFKVSNFQDFKDKDQFQTEYCLRFLPLKVYMFYVLTIIYDWKCFFLSMMMYTREKVNLLEKKLITKIIRELTSYLSNFLTH